MKDEYFKIEVETYSGHKGAERPVAFVWKGRRIQCRQIKDRWYGPDHEYFKVEGDDQRDYTLRYDRTNNVWEISLIKTAKTQGPK